MMLTESRVGDKRKKAHPEYILGYGISIVTGSKIKKNYQRSSLWMVNITAHNKYPVACGGFRNLWL